MRRLTGLMLAFSTWAYAANGPVTDVTGFVGPTLSRYTISPPLSGSQSSNVMLSVGGLFGFNLENSDLGGELGLFIAGRAITATVDSDTAKLIYSFLEIPFLIRYMPSFFILEAGPYLGIPLSSSIRQTVSGVTTNYSASNPNVDLGLKMSVGGAMNLNEKVKLRLQAIYSYGLTNLSKGSSTQYSRNVDFLVGAQFRLE